MEKVEKEECLRWLNGSKERWARNERNPRNKKLRVESFRDKACIVVPLPDGREFYLYPHYKALPLVNGDKMTEYEGREMSAFEALYDERTTDRMIELLTVDSPAAKYVGDLGFELPTLMLLQAILFYRKEINEWAEKIGGDIIADNAHCWSSSRYYAYSAWYANGYFGFFSSSIMYVSNLCCPVSLKS